MVDSGEMARRVGTAMKGLGSGVSRRMEARFYARSDPFFLKELAASADEKRRKSAAKRDQDGAGRRCPNCSESLEERDHKGVIIDICPACHGIWLDEGELELLTEGNTGLLKSLREMLTEAF